MASENTDRDAFLETIANELGKLNDLQRYAYLTTSEGETTRSEVLRIDRQTGAIYLLESIVRQTATGVYRTMTWRKLVVE